MAVFVKGRSCEEQTRFVARCQVLLIILTIFTALTKGESDICIADSFHVQCEPNEVIVMQHAFYGRMEIGRCLPDGSVNVGCSNDVLGLLDKWCSGQNMCDFRPIVRFSEIQTKWCGDMLSFLRAEHTCLGVTTKPFSYCALHPNVKLANEEGYLASHVTDKTGCGSASKPWIIQANTGQTINLTLIDFGALERQEKQTDDTNCPVVYGYILERSLAINKTLCGSMKKRSEVVYHSTGNTVELHIVPSHKRISDDRFLIHYKRIGCSDLTPPSGTWYKREGSQASIGCDNGARKWDLVCRNNAWDGVVGNCSLIKGVKVAQATSDDNNKDFPMTKALWLGGIIAGTLCLSLIITAIGIVYMKRYRKKRQTRSSRRTSLTSLSKNTASTQKTISSSSGTSKYRPVSYHGTCVHGNTRRERSHNRKSYPSSRNSYPRPETPSRDSTGHYYSHIWETPLPNQKDSSKNVTKTSPDNEYLAPRSEQLRNVPETHSPEVAEEEDFDDNMSSYYSPNTGHKYYVLDRTITQQQGH